MRKIKILVFMLCLTAASHAQTHFIRQSMASVYKGILAKSPTAEIDTGTYDVGTGKYLIVNPDTPTEITYQFHNGICTLIGIKDYSFSIATYVAKFNKKPFVYDKKSDRFYDTQKRCYWKIENMPNQKIRVTCTLQ